VTEEPDRYARPSELGNEPEPLVEHLEDVASRVPHVVPSEAKTPEGEPLSEVVRQVSLVHDLGKGSRWFQQHIGMIEGEPGQQELTHHSMLGALAAFYVLDRTGRAEETALAGFLAVAKHHGTFTGKDVHEFIVQRTEWNQREADNREQSAAVRQVKDIDDRVPTLAASIIHTATDGDGAWSEFADAVADRSLFESVLETVQPRFLDTPDPKGLPDTLYGTVLRVWGALVFADKTSAASAPNERATYAAGDTGPDSIERHVERLQSNAPDSGRAGMLNDLRAEAREGVLSRLDPDVSLATLTLPTGFGKTLTGIDAALRLRDMTDCDRVVYALPFTSIIDQVGDELTDLFDSNGHDDRLVLHHHLAETARDFTEGSDDIATKNGRQLDPDQLAAVEEMLGESWRSAIVLTTFVQLFESLTGPKNPQSMKIPALENSVVILDEPQGIPHDWWPLVNRLVDLLIEQFNAVIIAMTATQPRLFERQSIELVPEPERYFQSDTVERVRYELHDSALSYDEGEPLPYEKAANRVSRMDGSVLAVCNTIDGAQALTEALDSSSTTNVGAVLRDRLAGGAGENVAADELTEAVIEREGRPLMHLSTRIRPRDRLTLIDTAKRLTARGVPLRVVSTQLIEAGVDISFDAVCRDFAPVDSIVQAAGRCNRSFERKCGNVTVWWLEPPAGKTMTPAKAVYDRRGSRLSATAEALDSVRSRKQDLAEQTVAWEAVNAYYEEMGSRDPGNREWVAAVDQCRTATLGDASIIDQKRTVEVVVCRTDDDRQKVSNARKAWEQSAFTRLDELIDELRPLQVSVPVYRDDTEEARRIGELPLLHGDATLRILDTDERRFENYFDPTTGLVIPDNTVEARFL